MSGSILERILRSVADTQAGERPSLKLRQTKTSLESRTVRPVARSHVKLLVGQHQVRSATVRLPHILDFLTMLSFFIKKINLQPTIKRIYGAFQQLDVDYYLNYKA